MKLATTIEVFFRFSVLAMMSFLIWKQTSKFIGNNCVPFLVYKKFYQSPSDIYPVFTFCLEKGIGMYDSDFLEKLGANASDYQEFLTGGYADDATESKMKEIDFNETMIKFQNIGLMYKTIWQNSSGGTAKQVWKTNKKENGALPWIKSYQSPIRICFSRNQNYGPKGIRAHEHLTLNKTFLNMNEGKFRVYHHYKNQRMRRTCKHIFQKNMKKMNFKTLEFFESQVNVVRRRIDANDPCDPNVNDDQAAMEAIMKKAKCVPTYWKGMTANDNRYPNCTSPQQLKTIYKVLKTVANILSIFSEFTEPCNKLSSVITFQEFARHPEDDPNTLLLKFNHLEETYLEITNHPEFNTEMLWSCIGGLVGMFLGYSLWHMPDILSGWNVVERVKELKA